MNTQGVSAALESLLRIHRIRDDASCNLEAAKNASELDGVRYWSRQVAECEELYEQMRLRLTL
jgi:hypothetical protein